MTEDVIKREIDLNTNINMTETSLFFFSPVNFARTRLSRHAGVFFVGEKSAKEILEVHEGNHFI